jgi:hypothetical protein
MQRQSLVMLNLPLQWTTFVVNKLCTLSALHNSLPPKFAIELLRYIARKSS